MNEGDLHRTAIHEAGHIVVAKALGRYVRSAVLQNDGTADVWHDRALLPGTEVSVDLRITLAGLEAEKLAGLFNEESVPRSHQDLDEVKRLLGRLRPPDRPAGVLEWCRAQSSALLKDRWPKVERLAEDLEEHRVLVGSDITRILAEVGQR